MGIDVCVFLYRVSLIIFLFSEFGDLTKTVVSNIGTGVADAVQEFTGKDQYGE